MQGKGLIKFFLVVITLVCLIQYAFILPTNKVENDAESHAMNVAQNYTGDKAETVAKEARTNYLDSMSSEVVLDIPLIKSYTYEELKKQQLALGLDLKGGMSVVLQVDLREFIIALSSNSKDPTFLEALDRASERLKTAQSDYVTLFAEEFRAIAEDKKMAPIFLRNEALRDQINFETSDGEVVRIIRAKANETVELTFNRLKERIDELGVAQPNVSLDASRDLIIVELPGVDNPERARNFLQATAKLEFWEVYRITDAGLYESFIQADQRLKQLRSGDTTDVAEVSTTRIDTVWSYDYDTLGQIVDSSYTLNEVEETPDPIEDAGPLLKQLQLNATGEQAQLTMSASVMGLADKNKRDAISDMLNKPEIKNIFPNNLEFRWSYKPAQDPLTGIVGDQYELYAIKKRRGKETAPLQGDRVINARSYPNPTTGEVVVSLSMDNQGAKIWGDMTTRAAQDNNREIAIALDDKIVSCPRVNEPILGGDSQISGNFSVQEAEDLASILEVGKLPAKTNIIQEALVGPSLGQENINRSLRSLLIGFGMVFIFMILYYGSGGIVSIIALLMNIFFIFGALSSVGTVLTLPGIAGIVLTIGMAVDANVIIYERIREEIREGKGMLMAIQDGFSNSYSAIIDANVTTILTAIVLAYFGLGPIKGFAVVLIIGVLSSLFTAVLIGRLVIEWWTSKGRSINFYTGWSKNILANPTFDWLGKRKIAYSISSVLLIIGLVSMFALRGFELGVDFKGGYSYNIEFADEDVVAAEELRGALNTAFGSMPVVKAVDTENTFNVTTSYLINDPEDDAADRVMTKLHEGVNGLVGGSISLDQFKSPDGKGTHVESSSKVGPTIADDIKSSSFYAAIFALLLIFLYIFLRFNKWQYSLGAVAALFHDVLIVLGIFSLGHGFLPFSLEIDQAFIAAILTVIGYSINDTVVVFDRIREFMNTYMGKSKSEIINMAVNSTISRTIITSLTTFFVVAVLFFFGGSSIKGFAFALMVGIVVGTYSSVFVATPIMADMSGDLEAKQSSKKKTSFSKAASSAR